VQHHVVAGGGGVRLNVVETGRLGGRPILFIHGWSQSHVSWTRQLTSAPLGERFRLVALDLRGHGDSEKPVDAYGDSRLWADDVAAVIDALALRKPVLCGWSYGGYVVNDYLRVRGGATLGGLNYVSAATDAGVATDYRFLGAGWDGILPVKGSPSPTAYSEGAEDAALVMRRFVRNCFAKPPGVLDELTLLGVNLSVPPRVRRGLFARRVRNDEILEAIALPTLVTHGEADAIIDVETGKHIASRIAGARLSLYPGVGHLPFWEDAERYNRELAAFVSELPV